MAYLIAVEKNQELSHTGNKMPCAIFNVDASRPPGIPPLRRTVPSHRKGKSGTGNISTRGFLCDTPSFSTLAYQLELRRSIDVAT
jgi:hypothetical protein